MGDTWISGVHDSNGRKLMGMRQLTRCCAVVVFMLASSATWAQEPPVTVEDLEMRVRQLESALAELKGAGPTAPEPTAAAGTSGVPPTTFVFSFSPSSAAADGVSVPITSTARVRSGSFSRGRVVCASNCSS